MLRPYPFLDEIQTAVYTVETVDPDLLRGPAEKYAEVCAEVNLRLRQAGDLLREGLRSEAIHIAESEPNLLDMVAMLDFPELPTWCELLRESKIPLPPPLLIDVAADLNDAYAAQQPLDGLLKKHRLLALARSPLSARVHILRIIQQRDPMNATWQEDVEVLEKVLLKEIARNVKAAYDRDDLRVLAKYNDELSDNGWSVSVPRDLTDQVKTMRDKLAAKFARTKMVKIEKELTAAHATFDTAAGRKARTRWQEAVEIARVGNEDPLLERSAPALEWLDEQDETDTLERNREADWASLRRALDDHEPPDILERLYHAASKYDVPLPKVMERRFREQIASTDLSRKRKHRIVLASVVVSVLVAGCVIGLLIVQQNTNRRIAASTQALKKLIDDGHLSEAVTLFDELVKSSPGIAKSSEVQQEKGRLDAALKTEEGRAAAFLQAFTRAEKAGLESPDRQALEQARQHAKTPSEKERLSEFKARVAEVDNRRRKERETKFQEQLAELRNELVQLESLESTDERLTPKSLYLFRSKIQGVVEGAVGISSALRAQAKPLIARVNVLSNLTETRLDQRRQRDQLTSAVGDLERFCRTLQTFVEKHPDSPGARSYERAIEEDALWEGMNQWSDYLSSPVFRNVDSWTPDIARSLLEQGNALAAQYGDAALAVEFEKRKDLLQSMAVRDKRGGNESTRDLLNLFQQSLIADLWMIELKSNNAKYYMKKKPVWGRNTKVRTIFKYIADSDLSEKSMPLKKDGVVYEGRAPQSIVADLARKQLNTLSGSNWEPTFSEMLASALDQERMDPVLKLIIVERILQTASEGSSIYRKEFGLHLSILKDSGVNRTAPWMLPFDDNAGVARNKAEDLFESMPSLKQGIKQVEAASADMRTPPTRYSWIGWLGQHRDNTWKLYGKNLGDLSGELVIVRKQAIQTQAELIVIGRLDRGRDRIKNSSDGRLLAGRPVYLKVPPRSGAKS